MDGTTDDYGGSIGERYEHGRDNEGQDKSGTVCCAELRCNQRHVYSGMAIDDNARTDHHNWFIEDPSGQSISSNKG